MVFSPYSKNSFQGIKIQYIYHVPIYIYIRPRWNYSTNQTLHPYLPLPSLSPTVRRNTAATSIRFTGTFLDDDISPRIPLINSYLPRFSIRGLPSQFRGSREIYYTPQTDNAKSTPPPPSPSCLITGVRLYCHGSSFTRLHLYPTLPPTLRSVVDYRIMRDHLLSRFTGWPNAVESNEDRDRASRSAKRIKIRDRENYINIFDYIYLRSKINRIDRIE